MSSLIDASELVRVADRFKQTEKRHKVPKWEKRERERCAFPRPESPPPLHSLRPGQLTTKKMAFDQTFIAAVVVV